MVLSKTSRSDENSISEDEQLNRINLQALQNHDPYIDKILDQAQRVCMYKFLADKREWERKDIEGTLFVYERKCEPYHGLIILSAISRETFVQIIKSDMEFKHSNNHEAFLQYKVDLGDINGIWFISKNDCPRVTECLKDLTNRAKELQQIPSNQTNDIFSLLFNAQEKFDESKRKLDVEHSNSIKHDEREQELKKALGIIDKSTINVNDLENQFLQTSTESCTLTNAIQNWTNATQNPFPEFEPNSHSMKFSKNILRQILLDMLQNDEEFLTSLHNAYTKKYNHFH